MYDVYDNELKELHHGPKEQPSIFEDLDIGFLDIDTRRLLNELEEAFSSLESVVQWALKDILNQISDYTSRNDSYKSSLSLSRVSAEEVRKYFILLRFRNSEKYQDIICSLHDEFRDQGTQGNVTTLFQPLIARNRLRCILREFTRFLDHRSNVPSGTQLNASPMDSFLSSIESYCWSLCHAEVCFGIAQDEQEFIFSDRCFGTLDDEESYVFPIKDIFFYNLLIRSWKVLP